MKKEIILVSLIVLSAIFLTFASINQSSIVGYVMKFDTDSGSCVDYEDSNFYNLKYQKGHLEYDGQTYEDKCINDRIVREYYCSKYGFLVKKNIVCDYDEICQDGKCINIGNAIFLITPFSNENYESLLKETKSWLEENNEKEYYSALEENIPVKKSIIILGNPCDYKDKVYAIFIDKINWQCYQHQDLLNISPNIGIYWEKDYGSKIWKWYYNLNLSEIKNIDFKESKINFITENEVINNLAINSTECDLVDLDKNNFINETDQSQFNSRYERLLLRNCGPVGSCKDIDYNEDDFISGYDERIFNDLFKENKEKRCWI